MAMSISYTLQLLQLRIRTAKHHPRREKMANIDEKKIPALLRSKPYQKVNNYGC
jgi:hypothetical protein